MLSFREVPPTLSLCLGENDAKFISTWNLGDSNNVLLCLYGLRVE